MDFSVSTPKDPLFSHELPRREDPRSNADLKEVEESIRTIINVMVDPNPMTRYSTTKLRQFHVVVGWAALLSDVEVKHLPEPKTSHFLLPFITALNQNVDIELRQRAYEYMILHKGDGVNEALISHGVVPRMVDELEATRLASRELDKLVNSSSTSPLVMLLGLLTLRLPSKIQALCAKYFDSLFHFSHPSSVEATRAFIACDGVRRLIRMCVETINEGEEDISACWSVITTLAGRVDMNLILRDFGIMHIFNSKFKEAKDGMKSIIAGVFEVMAVFDQKSDMPFLRQYLQYDLTPNIPRLGLAAPPIYFSPSHDQTQFNLRTTTLNLSYLEPLIRYLSNLPPADTRRVTRLFKYKEVNSFEIINTETIPYFRTIVEALLDQDDMALVREVAEILINAVPRSIYNIDDLVVNSRSCIRKATGPELTLPSYFTICLTCSTLSCRACAAVCHRYHKLSPWLPLVGNNCKCRSSSCHANHEPDCSFH